MGKRSPSVAILILESILLLGFGAFAVSMLATPGTTVQSATSLDGTKLTNIAHLQGVLTAYSQALEGTFETAQVQATANDLADVYLLLLQSTEDLDVVAEDRTQIDLLAVKGMETAAAIAQATQRLQEGSTLLNSTIAQLTEIQTRLATSEVPQRYKLENMAAVMGGLVLCVILIALTIPQMRHKGPIQEAPSQEELPEDIRESIDPQSGGVTSTVFDLIMPREIYRMKRYGHELSLLSIRIDQFSDLIRAEGEDGAAYVISSLGETIAANTRASDLFARIAQNRFILVLPETDGKGAVKVAEKIRRNTEIFPYDTDTQSTVSIGAVQCTEDEDMERLLGRAESASQRALAAGGNKILHTD